MHFKAEKFNPHRQVVWIELYLGYILLLEDRDAWMILLYRLKRGGL